MSKTMRVRINDELSKEGSVWWYRFHLGEIFEVKRDPNHPRTYFHLERDGINHQIRCCDCRIVK